LNEEIVTVPIFLFSTDEDKAREALAEQDEVDRIAKIETLLSELKKELLSMKK